MLPFSVAWTQRMSLWTRHSKGEWDNAMQHEDLAIHGKLLSRSAPRSAEFSISDAYLDWAIICSATSGEPYVDAILALGIQRESEGSFPPVPARK